ncbi:hypothetical protein FA13DRAFT_1811707 [Coprinellus micaceus]|uniref:Uncharacterized protein n=1 Tax=Coprinellus micaceus TaxID=71717 RepID=A0A4Y7TNQ1_COPMI|nr:hypothetical protein FA13DRAFT_1811707 [Coprinellus micaceus]
MSESMEVDMAVVHDDPQPQLPGNGDTQENSQDLLSPLPTPVAAPSNRDFRDIQVKVHIRRPEKDSWMYLGRGVATQEVQGHSSRVVVRSQTSGKVIAEFDEASDLQAEKRGNFVVIGLVDGPRVVSWSLNALNNSETLRLLACIELACYRCKQAVVDPRSHVKTRRRIERVIKDDRRRRHRRRKDQEAMIDAFAKQTLSSDLPQGTPNSANTTPLPGQSQTV